MPQAFRYYLRVRYGECDGQKVVFNARYAEYVDIATGEFLRAIGFGEALATGKLDFEVVKHLLEGQPLGKMALPADQRAALERGARGVVTDHGGYLSGVERR